MQSLRTTLLDGLNIGNLSVCICTSRKKPCSNSCSNDGRRGGSSSKLGQFSGCTFRYPYTGCLPRFLPRHEASPYHPYRSPILGCSRLLLPPPFACLLGRQRRCQQTLWARSSSLRVPLQSRLLRQHLRYSSCWPQHWPPPIDCPALARERERSLGSDVASEYTLQGPHKVPAIMLLYMTLKSMGPCSLTSTWMVLLLKFTQQLPSSAGSWCSSEPLSARVTLPKCCSISKSRNPAPWMMRLDAMHLRKLGSGPISTSQH
jgi:hypothetical protein